MDSRSEPMRILITGVTGFTGRYVAAEFVGAGYDVAGLVHPAAEAVVPGVDVHAADLLDRDGLRSLVGALDVDAVLHLAAISFVGHGDADELYR
ncbi:MAG TPA: NAD-dependent epimerase/dehydratase family protein, partial [Pseudonocardiaceae bacterium]|nr:NAD-dependent epimerase/dehydratase family protein [Pseudonocardiaceae bacterium]